MSNVILLNLSELVRPWEILPYEQIQEIRDRKNPIGNILKTKPWNKPSQGNKRPLQWSFQNTAETNRRRQRKVDRFILDRINTVKLVALLNAICRFNAAPPPILTIFFTEISNLILRSDRSMKDPPMNEATLNKKSNATKKKQEQQKKHLASSYTAEP